MPRIHCANSPGEALNAFGRAFYEGKTPAELDERVQLGSFLEAAAYSSLLEYPIEVEHTREAKPDFRMKLAAKTIGVEMTKVANRNLEQARHFQHKHKLGTLSVSPFLKGSSQKRNPRDIVQDGFCMPAMLFGSTEEEEDAFWLHQANAIVSRKGAIMKKPGFVHFQETWLVLWDKLSSEKRDLDRRAEQLSYSLQRFWQEDWFSKIIIEQAQFSVFLILTKRGVSVL